MLSKVQIGHGVAGAGPDQGSRDRPATNHRSGPPTRRRRGYHDERHSRGPICCLRFRSDMESLGPVRIKEVETAQQQIIALVRQLEGEGVITMKGTVGDQYVV